MICRSLILFIVFFSSFNQKPVTVIEWSWTLNRLQCRWHSIWTLQLKQEGLRRFIDSRTVVPRIGSLSCRPFPPFNNKGRELAGIKQILHHYSISSAKLESPDLIKTSHRDRFITCPTPF